MYKKNILVIIGLVICSLAHGQFEHIQFKSEFEKEVLTNLDNHSSLEMLLAIAENASEGLVSKTYENIKTLKSELNRKKFDSKPEDKRLKLLFDLTHKYFFLKYRDISNFDQIFETKEYNCVSATALYSLILEDYNIPYAIKETPTHVFAIAYPKSKNIVLESTAPKNGYYKPSNNDIQKAVGSLVDLKYYTKEEVEAKGTLAVYNEFFYNEDQIELQKLAGLQYHNEAISLLAE